MKRVHVPGYCSHETSWADAKLKFWKPNQEAVIHITSPWQIRTIREALNAIEKDWTDSLLRAKP